MGDQIVLPSGGSFDAEAFVNALLPLSVSVCESGKVTHVSRGMGKSVQELRPAMQLTDIFEICRPEGYEELTRLNDPTFFVVIADRGTGNEFKCCKLNAQNGHFILACTPLLNEQNSPADYKLSVSDFAPHDIIAEYLFVMKANQMGMREANELIESVSAKNMLLEQARQDLVKLNELLEDRAARTEENLRQAEHELVEGEKLALLGRLAAGVAHEMNTPLGAITASTENLNSSLWPMITDSITGTDPAILVQACRLAEKYSALQTLTSREERAEKGVLAQFLRDRYGEPDAERHARVLVDCGITVRHTEILAHIYSSADVVRSLDITTSIMRVRRSISTIELAAQKSANVIRALKSYVRNDAGDAATVFDARRSISDVLLLFNSQIKRGVKLHMNMQGELPVRGNETEVSKIWANLISNALYAMSYKGNLWVEGAADNDLVTLRFSNDGPPIPANVRDRLFEAFFTTKPIGEGSGMGLNIVTDILTSMHGSISVHSEELTTFTISLPKAN